MRVVVDTNIVASGYLWRGAPSRLLNAGIDQRFDFISSNRLIDEFAGVIGRPKFEAQLTLSGRTARQLVADYRDLCTIVTPAPLEPIAPDPDDDWVIATAVAARADLIVTGDKPFLGIGKVGDIRIVSVTDALQVLTSG